MADWGLPKSQSPTVPDKNTGPLRRHEAVGAVGFGTVALLAVELAISGPPQGVLTMSTVKKLVGTNEKITAYHTLIRRVKPFLQSGVFSLSRRARAQNICTISPASSATQATKSNWLNDIDFSMRRIRQAVKRARASYSLMIRKGKTFHDF
jgi:hypothetical protein